MIDDIRITVERTVRAEVDGHVSGDVSVFDLSHWSVNFASAVQVGEQATVTCDGSPCEGNFGILSGNFTLEVSLPFQLWLDATARVNPSIGPTVDGETTLYKNIRATVRLPVSRRRDRT